MALQAECQSSVGRKVHWPQNFSFFTSCNSLVVRVISESRLFTAGQLFFHKGEKSGGTSEIEKDRPRTLSRTANKDSSSQKRKKQAV